MTKDNEDALRCADRLDRSAGSVTQLDALLGLSQAKHGRVDRDKNAAHHIRRLVAENEAQAALLRQAVEALKTCQIRVVSEWEVRDVTPKIVREALSAITKVTKEPS